MFTFKSIPIPVLSILNAKHNLFMNSLTLLPSKVKIFFFFFFQVEIKTTVLSIERSEIFRQDLMAQLAECLPRVCVQSQTRSHQKLVVVAACLALSMK